MTHPRDVFDHLVHIALLLQQDLTQSFAGTPLTPSRTHLLWVVYRQGPSTQAALAAALDVTARNVTGLVDALEQANYLRRRPHPQDRRATLVTLTDLGTGTMERMARERDQIADALGAGMTSAELAILEAHLVTIAERLQMIIDKSQEESS